MLATHVGQRRPSCKEGDHPRWWSGTVARTMNRILYTILGIPGKGNGIGADLSSLKNLIFTPLPDRTPGNGRQGGKGALDLNQCSPALQDGVGVHQVFFETGLIEADQILVKLGTDQRPRMTPEPLA